MESLHANLHQEYDDSLDKMLNLGQLDNCDIFKDRNELKVEKIKELEKEIFGNSSIYINLMENNFEDKTDALLKEIEKLCDKKETIDSQDFKLSETMNCYEYNHQTMDMRINYNKFENYKTITLKYADSTTWNLEKTILFIDRLFLEECQYLFNNIFPTQSILSCVLFHKNKGKFEFNNYVNVFLNISRHLMYLSTEMIFNSTSARDINPVQNHKLLEIKEIDNELQQVVNRLNEELSVSNNDSNKVYLEKILNRLKFKINLINILKSSLVERDYSIKSFIDSDDYKLQLELIQNLENESSTLVKSFSDSFPTDIEILFQSGLYKCIPIVCNIKKVIPYSISSLENNMQLLVQGFKEALLMLKDNKYFNLLSNLSEFADKYNYAIIRSYTELFFKDKKSNLSNGRNIMKMIEVSHF